MEESSTWYRFFPPPVVFLIFFFIQVTSSKFLNLSKGDALEVALKLLRDKDTSFVEAANLLLAVSNRTKDPRLFADVILAMNEAGVKPNVATFVEILLSDKAPPEVYLPAADGILLSSTPVSNSPLSLVVINLLKLGHNEKGMRSNSNDHNKTAVSSQRAQALAIAGRRHQYNVPATCDPRAV